MQDQVNKWTPGPWRVRTRVAFGEVADCFVAASSVSGEAYDAEILGDDEYREGVDRKLADAHLISAAPELYEELERAVGLIDGELTGAEWKEACHAFVRDARAVLAKARGAQ